MADDVGKEMRIAIVPLISLAQDRESALAKVNVEGVLEESGSKPAWRPDGPFESAEDLHGALIAGNADDIVGELKQLESRGRGRCRH